MKNTKPYLLLLLMVLISVSSYAQIKAAPLKVGDKIPNIEIKNITNSDSSSFHLSHFRGKAVIIDFWGTWCASCVAALPKVMELQQKFKNDVQFITVSEEKAERVKKFFSFGPYKNMKIISAAAGNALLSQYFPHQYVPHEVWLDRNGIVKAITGSEQITPSNIEKLIRGEPMVLESDSIHWLDPTENDRELGKLILDSVPNIKAESFMTNYIRGQANMCLAGPEDLRSLSRGFAVQYETIDACNVYPIVLYKIAFGYPTYGSSYPNQRIVLGLKDSLNHETFSKNHKANDTDLVCYFLRLRRPDSIRLYKKMQEDLADYFNIHAEIKKVDMPCYIVTVTDSTKLISKGGTTACNKSLLFYRCSNMPLSKFINELNSYNEGTKPGDGTGHIILDETNFHSRVDLDIVGPFNDLPALRTKLKNCGLALIEAERKIDMLVLSD